MHFPQKWPFFAFVLLFCSVNFLFFIPRKEIEWSCLCHCLAENCVRNETTITVMQSHPQQVRKREHRGAPGIQKIQKIDVNTTQLQFGVAIQNKMLFLFTLLFNKPQTHRNISWAPNKHNSPKPQKIMFALLSLYFTPFSLFSFVMAHSSIWLKKNRNEHEEIVAIYLIWSLDLPLRTIHFEGDSCLACGFLLKQSSDIA